MSNFINVYIPNYEMVGTHHRTVYQVRLKGTNIIHNAKFSTNKEIYMTELSILQQSQTSYYKSSGILYEGQIPNTFSTVKTNSINIIYYIITDYYSVDDFTKDIYFTKIDTLILIINTYNLIPDYLITNNLLGEGGYSHVFKAINYRDKKLYIIKLFKVKPNSIVLYEHETYMLQKILDKYGCINDLPCLIYHGNIKDTLYYIVTKDHNYIDLINYYETTDDKYYYDIINIAINIAYAVKLLNDANIIHNDLKLDNILIAQDSYEVSLIDFGAACIIDDPKYPCSNKSPMLTIDYSAPEKIIQHLTNYVVDDKSEIFAIGAIYYYLFTGRHLYRYEDIDQHIDHLLNDDKSIINLTLSQINFDQSLIVKLTDLIKKMVSFYSKDRPDINSVISTLFEIRDEYDSIYGVEIMS